ncbi:MAG TPA: cupredoxin domain-containing protein [Patescibacteria group bacterium]|nr:cupredoxin domain-containing protein [Patescibacteria group bacterium]
MKKNILKTSLLLGTLILTVFIGGCIPKKNTVTNEPTNNNQVQEINTNQNTNSVTMPVPATEINTNQAANTNQDQQNPTNNNTNQTPEISVKIFNVTASNFSYSVKEIRVKKGDKVKIVFFNQEGFHNLIIDEFGVATKTINANQTETVEFSANKTGTFEYYCGVGAHRQLGMVGKLIVE